MAGGGWPVRLLQNTERRRHVHPPQLADGPRLARAQSATRRRLGTEEYENVAAQMYALAAQYRSGDEMGEVFQTLGEHVTEAKKPINFLSEHYLGYKRDRLFEMAG